MPEAKRIYPFKVREDYDEEAFLLQTIKEAREYLLKRLEEAYSIPYLVFSKICMLSMIDMLAQEWNNYPVNGSGAAFSKFVEKFADKYDFWEWTDPITLFYEYEPKIQKIIKSPRLHQMYPDQFPPELEVTLGSTGTYDNKSIREIAKTSITDKLISLIDRQEDAKQKKRLIENHSFIKLLYKFRSKAVHELSSMGSEIKGANDDADEPYYRDMGRMYVDDNFIVSCNVVELVIPRKFIYDLTLTCITNYLNYCQDEHKLPFQNNAGFKRPVDLTWVDK